jgi:hypothetical protein
MHGKQMSADLNIAPEVVVPLPGSAGARCPHLVYRNVLGAKRVAALLDYVAARRADFRPAVVRDRTSGTEKLDQRIRDCLYFKGLGPFEGPIKAFVDTIAAQALGALHLVEPKVEPREFTLTAFGNGGRFIAHIDTNERTDRVRVLSCVYYFAAMPRRFGGGELRLYGFPKLSPGKKPELPPFVDVSPETDTLVVFPSWLEHEVLPVSVPSGAWADGRFTINCWVHRAATSAEGTPAAAS